MKAILLSLLLLAFAAPIVHAGTDCEENCCKKFSGRWDEDFDDCKSYKSGYDQCESDCEAAVWANLPQGPGPASPENTYHYDCTPKFIFLALVAGAIFFKAR